MKHLTRDDIRLLAGFLGIILTPEIIERSLRLIGA